MQSGEKRSCGRHSPASLVYNWQKDLVAPQLQTVIVAGSVPERASTGRHSKEGEILITLAWSYKARWYMYLKFVFAILRSADGAPSIRIRPPMAKVWKDHCGIQTCIDRNTDWKQLSELWSILIIWMPGFWHHQKFRGGNCLIAVNQKMQTRWSAYSAWSDRLFVRRLKGDVLKDLPEKIEENGLLDGEQM